MCHAMLQPKTHVPSNKLAARGMVTVVGSHKEMAIGQHVMIDGRWVVHKKYGSQLQVINPRRLTSVDPSVKVLCILSCELVHAVVSSPVVRPGE